MEDKNNNFEKIMIFIHNNKIYFFIGLAILFLTCFLGFSKENPTSFNGMIKKADSYAESGKIAFALEEYNKLVRLYPGNYDLHLKLGALYEEVNEIDRAKIEYIRAIKLEHLNRFEANIALARLYMKEDRYGIAKDIIKEIEGLKIPKLQEDLGKIYYEWGTSLQAIDRIEAIRKFKKARVYFKKASSKYAKEAFYKITRVYADISDTLVENNEIEKAIEILNHSIYYENNALAHYKLAKIYEKEGKIDKAIEEYSDSFKMDSEVGNKNSYVELLVNKAIELDKNGENVKAELYRLKAKKLDAKVDVPENPNNKILFNLIATKINEDIERDVLIPGIIFKITNISDRAVNLLKVKIVFIRNEKPISTKILTVADPQKPINGDSATSNISVYSDKYIKHVFDDHDLRVQVFISQTSSDEWKLFRNIAIERNRKPVSIKK